MRITDGDTIVVTPDERIRFIGIDTPEPRPPEGPECFADDATARMVELLPVASNVRLVYDQDREDRYERTLAYVYRASDDLFVNATMIIEGYATTLVVRPNDAHADEFAALEAQARADGRGLWSACPG